MSAATKKESTKNIRAPKCPHERKPPSPAAYGQMIIVTVGKEDKKRSFHVYEGLLTYWSSYFRTALSPAWKEGNTNTIELPEDSVEVFEAFFHWLFTGTLSPEGSLLSFSLICEIHFFSDARGIPELGNAAIDVLFERTASEWVYPVGMIGYIYENTTRSSGLRKFMLDDGVVYPWEHFADDYEGGDVDEDALPPVEFFIDLLARARRGTVTIADMQRRPEDDVHIYDMRRKLCEYHEHVDTAAHTDE